MWKLCAQSWQGRIMLGTENNQPTRHVESFWHVGEGGSDRTERDAQTHDTTDAVRVTKSEVVGCHGPEILTHKECLHWSKMVVTDLWHELIQFGWHAVESYPLQWLETNLLLSFFFFWKIQSFPRHQKVKTLIYMVTEEFQVWFSVVMVPDWWIKCVVYTTQLLYC